MFGPTAFVYCRKTAIARSTLLNLSVSLLGVEREIMNYSEIVNALNNATGFDLFRIKVAIEKMLDDPVRILEVKKSLRKGQQIQYFEPNENTVVEAIILEFKRTRVLVKNIEDGARWIIPYYYVNIGMVDTGITKSSGRNGLDRNEVKVGDRIGFVDRENNDRYGEVVRLNQKTVTLNCDGEKWRVSYSLLFKIIGQDVECFPEL